MRLTKSGELGGMWWWQTRWVTGVRGWIASAGVLVGTAGGALAFGYFIARFPGIGDPHLGDQPVPMWVLRWGIGLLIVGGLLVAGAWLASPRGAPDGHRLGPERRWLGVVVVVPWVLGYLVVFLASPDSALRWGLLVPGLFPVAFMGWQSYRDRS